MDINKLYTAESHEEGAEMQVKDENGKQVDCFITVVGQDSKTWRKTFNTNKLLTLEYLVGLMWYEDSNETTFTT